MLRDQISHASPAWRAGAMALRQREPRRKVMIKARMRAGVSWSDACILNLSSRGMLVHAPTAPSRGSYLEIRRGEYVIVARVVWASSNKFGVRTQDFVPADGLIHAPDEAVQTRSPGASEFVERRATSRPAGSNHEQSRLRARALEFGTFIMLGGIAAMAILGSIGGLLARPLALVETALSKG